MYHPHGSGMFYVDSVIFLLVIHWCFWRMACLWYRGGVDWVVCGWRSSGVVEVVGISCAYGFSVCYKKIHLGD